MKPRVFIGSSTEGLDIARAVQSELREDVLAIRWGNGIFNLSQSVLNGLIEQLDSCDAGIFVFSADDAVKIRNQDGIAVRDNVLFELGLSIGKIGQHASFFIEPDDADGLRRASDLLGITAAPYSLQDAKIDAQSAISPACTAIRKMLQKLPAPKYRLYSYCGPAKVSEINQFMAEWIDDGGRTAIFSRDLSWAANDSSIFEKLAYKARDHSLIVCLPKKIPLIDELPGCEFYEYSSLGIESKSRFTVTRFGTPGAQVAIGRPDGKGHLIEVFRDARDPAVTLACDMIDFVRAHSREYSK